MNEHPIGNLVDNVKTWNPMTSGTGNFYYIDLSSLNKESKSIVTTEHIACSTAPSRARQIVETGDVLVATVRPNLNGVALVSDDEHLMTASTGFCVLRPNQDLLDSRFLFQWVKTRTFVQRMVDLATGANYPAVSDAKVKASTIPLPPLAEQKRIAKILDAADTLRAKRAEALDELNTFLQSTFLDMFGDPVTNSRGWHTAPLGAVSLVNPRLLINEKPKPEDMVSFVPMAAVSESTQSIEEEVERPFSEVCKGYTPFKRGDVLVAKITPCFENGKMAIADNLLHEFGFGTTEFHVFRPTEKILGSYLFNCFRVPYFRQVGAKKMRGAVGQRRIPIDFFSSLKIPLPPMELQARFNNVVDSVGRQIVMQRTHKDELNTFFASLQSRAFQGKL